MRTWFRRLAFAGMLVLTVFSFATTVAMTVSGAFVGLVSAAAEAVLGVSTVMKRQKAETATIRKQLDDEIATSKKLRHEVAESVAENDRLKRELAKSAVTYRGARKTAGEAVADTSGRVASRIAKGAGRDVASTVAEALPFVGATVIAAATAYELYDACETMKDLHALDVAFNPESAISEREVCGMQAPSAEEIWTSVKASPGAAWSTATGYYQGLPEIDAAAMLESAKGWMSSFEGWLPSWNLWAEDADEAGTQADVEAEAQGDETTVSARP